MANPIEDDPELARAVGLLAGRWGLVEFMVFMIFALVAEMPDRKATIIFSFFKATGTQRDILRLLIGETPRLSDDLKARLNAALSDYVTLSGERNEVIHFPFGWDTKVEPHTQYKMTRARSGPKLHIAKPTSAKSVLALADRVKALFDVLKPLHIEALQAMHDASPDTPGPLPPDQNRKPWSGLSRPDPSPDEEP